jgi:hypothetical protein
VWRKPIHTQGCSASKEEEEEEEIVLSTNEFSKWNIRLIFQKI